MKKLLNGQGSIKSVKVIILVIILLFIFATLAFAYYRAKYTESAHGNTSYGVNRSSIAAFGYAQGNCAHCHEQHASIAGAEPTPPVAAGAEEYLLFATNNPSSQTDNFCFQCHKAGSVIQAVTNYTYSRNFGGGPITFSNIYDAFNPPSGPTPSSHNLADVLAHAVSRPLGFTANNNACVVCHNPHIAQRQVPVVLSGRGGVLTSIRRPLDYQSNPNNLWGDEDLATSGLMERMRDWVNRYQAPCYLTGIWPCNPATGPFEPANNTTADGSNLPLYPHNVDGFCMGECHRDANVTSTQHGPITRINWRPAGDDHGNNHDSGGLGATIAPYGNSNYNYVLSCTDCHEPHGSQNEWLLRTTVNGTNVSVPGPNQWMNFCSACHTFPQHTAPWGPTTDCYNLGVCHAHGRSPMF